MNPLPHVAHIFSWLEQHAPHLVDPLHQHMQNTYPPDITYNPNPNTNIPYSTHSLVGARHGQTAPWPSHGGVNRTNNAFIPPVSPVEDIYHQADGQLRPYLTPLPNGKILNSFNPFSGTNQEFIPPAKPGVPPDNTMRYIRSI